MNVKPDSPLPDGDLLALVSAVLNRTATPADCTELDRRLVADPEARRVYRQHLAIHASLQFLARAVVPVLPATVGRPPRRVWLFPRALAACAALVMLAVLAIFAWPRGGKDRATDGSETFAQVTRALAARAADPAGFLEPGRRLGGPLDLTHGLVELTFPGGATALLQGPVTVRLDGPRALTLLAGRLVVRAGQDDGAFVVRTPSATVTDRGTEFGVAVGPAGATQVQVFEGDVLAEWDGPGGRAELRAGEAVQIDSSAAAAHPLPFRADRFIRTFPPIETQPPGGPIYNRRQHTSVAVVPAPPGVVIDGNLADWDLSGRFRSACVEPYSAAYHVTGALMYDAERLYVGARVGDPAPLANRRDAAADPEMVWQGGSLVVRLGTDARLGWPLPAGRRHDGVASLLFWHEQATGKARLRVEYGLDYAESVLDPPGWQGCFVRDPDGQGYSVEAAVPWSVLRAPRPLRAGDVTALTWIVHWSDAAGKVGRGWLVDVLNPAARKYDMLDGTTWGQARFQPTPTP